MSRRKLKKIYWDKNIYEAYVWQAFMESMSKIYKQYGLSYTNILEIVSAEVQPVFENAIQFLINSNVEEKKNEKV